MSQFGDVAKTISLIGMPGAGKSTVGVLLAKTTGLAFRDTDLDIQVHARASLQDILDREGYVKLRQLEQEILLQIPLSQSVISTGGSVIYSDKVMRRLSAAGPVVFLAVDFETLAHRVQSTPGRGIASNSDDSFAQIFAERIPLYKQWANVVIDTSSYADADQVVRAIVEQLKAT
jgi:shikimate kinase